MGALGRVEFRFQVSDLTLLSVRRTLYVQQFDIGEVHRVPELPDLPLGCDGMMLRSIAHDDLQPSLTSCTLGGRRAIRYVMHCFPRYYIDMSQTFDSYKQKFGGKTLSTIRRKIKKYSEHCGGNVRWERFTRPDELERYWALAREVSSKTYQERLLDAGLPSNPSYVSHARNLADQDNVRAFLLFDGDKPVSYLFCPIERGVVQYAYLGYDPAYLRLSVGTVLQWLALESLFNEGRFRSFDFTEGESEHKRLFGTHHLRCANVAILVATFRNTVLVHAHWHFSRLVDALGQWLDRRNYRGRLRRWLRFGRSAAA